MNLQQAKEELEAFKRKLSSCEKRFKASDLEFWLGYLKSSTKLDANTYIKSLKHLKDVLVNLKKSEKRKHEKLFQYFEWFLKFIEYLRELRTIFCLQILQPLVSLNKHEEDGNDGVVVIPDLKNIILDIKTSSGLNESSINLIATLGDTEIADDLIQQLHSTVQYWEVYLNEKTTFDTDILHDEVSEERFLSMDVQYMLGLVNAVFRHCEKAGQIALEVMDLQSKNLLEHRMERIRKVQTILDERVSELDAQIRVVQGDVDSNCDLFQKLLKREERSNELNARLFEADQILNNQQKRLELIRANLSVPTSNDYDDLKLQEINLKHDIKVSEYRLNLLRKDIEIEMEVKPSFVRFTNSVQEKCQTLEAHLNNLQHLKSLLDRILTPVIKNGQRVQRDIIRKSVVSFDDKSTDYIDIPTGTASNTLQVPKQKQGIRDDVEY